MRKLLLATAAVSAVGFAAPAFAACNEDLQALNDKISANEGDYRVALTGSVANDVRTLRSAAQIFASNDMEEACEETVASINDLIEKRSASMRDEDMTLGSWSENEVERLKTAVPVNQRSKPLRAATIVGADVRNDENEDLGEIQDVVMDPQSGDIAYAILAHGGFLGIAEKQIAVPWEKLKVTDNNDAPVFVLNVSEKVLDEAPSFERDSWAEVDNAEWRKLNDAYYEDHSK